MKQAIKTLFLSIFTVALIANAYGQEGTSSPAEQKARALVQVISTGNRDDIGKFIQANYSDGFLKIPMDAHLGFAMARFDLSRGYEISAVQDRQPNSVTLLLKNKLTGDWEAVLSRLKTRPLTRLPGSACANRNRRHRKSPRRSQTKRSPAKWKLI